jgi:two-component system, chemotaxis family, chemotaxis protein CheY
MRVLIVDDSMVMRMVLELALRHARLDLADVVHAANGAEGLAALEDAEGSGAPFCLILSDIHMPVMNGLDFLEERQRRNLAAGVPFVILTADNTDPDLLLAIAAGGAGFICKPFTLQQMQSRVNALLLQAA